MIDENPYGSPQSDIGPAKFDGDAVIRVTRKKSFADADRIRAYRILIDGQERARLKAGQSVEIPVSSDTHSIVAKIDWCGSPTLDFSIDTGETVEFECGSNLRGLRNLLIDFYIIFWREEYLTLIRV